MGMFSPAIHVYFEYICWKFAGRLLLCAKELTRVKKNKRTYVNLLNTAKQEFHYFIKLRLFYDQITFK